MGHPELAENGQQVFWQGYITVLVAFTTMDMDKHTGTVDIGYLEMGAFLQSQAHSVDGCQADLVSSHLDLINKVGPI